MKLSSSSRLSLTQADQNCSFQVPGNWFSGFTGLYGNTKITLRDQVFITIIDDFELKQTKYTMSPENVK